MPGTHRTRDDSMGEMIVTIKCPVQNMLDTARPSCLVGQSMPVHPQHVGRPRLAAVAMTILGMLAGCSVQAQDAKEGGVQPDRSTPSQLPGDASVEPAGTKGKPTQLETATFGSGCFWCSEAVFERVKGVEKVVSGYSGGSVPNPSYQQVCTGLTGHAEVIQLTFDPSVISFADLLEIFWKTHDPTTLNQQGPDHGTQYRSVVFHHNDQQREIAEAYKQQLDESKEFKKPIVTEISPFKEFHPAEGYHQDYFELNRRQPYCARYISPKIKKFNRMFKDKLKGSEERDERP